MKLNIRRITGETHAIEYHDRPGATISNLKDQVAAHINMDRHSIKVCYKGKNLDDNTKMSDAHLEDNSTIIVVGQMSDAAPRKCRKRILDESEVLPKEISSSHYQKGKDTEPDTDGKKEKEAQLSEMGFLNEEIRHALQKFEYNLEKAVEYLLNQSQGDLSLDEQAGEDEEEIGSGEFSEEAEEKLNEILSKAFDFFQKVKDIPKFEEARQHVVEKGISPKDFADSICKLHPEYSELFAQHWDLWTEVVQHGIPDAESIVLSEYPSEEKP